MICKYDCIEYGLENQYFHCAEDNRHVRGKVFDIIGDHLDAVYDVCLGSKKRPPDYSVAGESTLGTLVIRGNL